VLQRGKFPVDRSGGSFLSLPIRNVACYPVVGYVQGKRIAKEPSEMTERGVDPLQALPSVCAIVVNEHLRKVRKSGLLGLRSNCAPLPGLANSALQQFDRVGAVRQTPDTFGPEPNTESTRSLRSFVR
jgi:hypothetical protein